MKTLRELNKAKLKHFYGNKLITSYFSKGGKSSIIFYLVSLLNSFQEKKKTTVSVLDLGCGEANLFLILNQLKKAFNYTFNFKFIGVDYNQKYKQNVEEYQGNFLNIDLTNSNQLEKTQFHNIDLILTINTLHEVFSEIIGINNHYPLNKIVLAKKHLSKIASHIKSSLSNNGRWILYDGINVEQNISQEKLICQFKSSKSYEEFIEIAHQFKPWPIHITIISKKDKKISVTLSNFLKIVSLKKYYGQDNFDLESLQDYHFLNIHDYLKIFKDAHLNLESISLISNDFGYWLDEIIVENLTTPIIYKSGLFVLK